MDIRQLYDYYAFGYNYRILKTGYVGYKIDDATWSINSFQDKIKSFDLTVTKYAIGKDLTDIYDKLKKLTGTDEMPDDMVKELSNFMQSVDKTLDAEMQLRDAYILTGKRLGLEKLTDKVEDLFGENVFSGLPDICQKDFDEAGKCIAFERHTAAAFHLLRATEGMLRVYYEHKVKRNRVKQLLWYNITQHLKGKRGVPDSLIAVLDSLREEFRNPTAHPEKIYNSDEVQTLFTHCIDVVSRLVKGVKKSKT